MPRHNKPKKRAKKPCLQANTITYNDKDEVLPAARKGGNGRRKRYSGPIPSLGQKGTIIFFQDGWGFILHPEGNVFVHERNCGKDAPGMTEGKRVVFDIIASKQRHGKETAVNVRLANGENPRHVVTFREPKMRPVG